MSTAKGDFVELQFTGRINGAVFDSNVLEDLKQLDSKAEPRKLSVIVGQSMVIKGLDSALEGKEIGTSYNVHVPFKEGFGPRIPSLVKTIPLKVFTEQKVYPEAGMTFALDNTLVSIRAVSGARVIADFNNPLSGKDLDYTFTIVRKISELDEKARVFFEGFLRGVPEFEVTDKVIVKGPPQLEQIINIFKQKFKELVGTELVFSVIAAEEKPVESKAQQQQSL